LLAPQRDLRLLIDDVNDSSFKFWDDFDYVVMGSPDVTRSNATFIAAQYRMSHSEMQRRITQACKTRGLTVDWRQDDSVTLGYPRFRDSRRDIRNKRLFVLLSDDKTAVYLREEFIPNVVAGPDASKSNTSGRFVANAVRVKPYIESEPKAELQFAIGGIRSLVAPPPDPSAEFPNSVKLMWEEGENPDIVVKLDFLDQDHAGAVQASWSDKFETELLTPKVRQATKLYFAKASVERVSSELIIHRESTSQEAQQLLQTLTREFETSIRRLDTKARAAKVSRRRIRMQRREDLASSEEGLEQAEERTQNK